jgi:aryl-alcohol dehydrogenase-like predicted oxidoreductase
VNDACARLSLGTAQWGAEYGIANRTGRPSRAQTTAMLTAARQAGAIWLDTAPAYGVAEDELGALGASASGHRISTKTPIDAITPQSIAAGLAASLAKLKASNVEACLFHRTDVLLGPDGAALWSAAVAAREAGLTKTIGVSVYDPEELEAVRARYDIDVVQLPYSLYDQRFADSFDDLASSGVAIHTRGALLQGVLAMVPEDLPPAVVELRDKQTALHRELAELGMTPAAAALHFCLDDVRVSRVVVGCETPEQLDQILDYARGPDLRLSNPARFAVRDPRLVVPALWPKAEVQSAR